MQSARADAASVATAVEADPVAVSGREGRSGPSTRDRSCSAEQVLRRLATTAAFGGERVFGQPAGHLLAGDLDP